MTVLTSTLHSLHLKRGVTGYDTEALEPCKLMGQLLGQAGGEVLLSRVACQVAQRHDGH
jgi:hypothetical protein